MISIKEKNKVIVGGNPGWVKVVCEWLKCNNVEAFEHRVISGKRNFNFSSFYTFLGSDIIHWIYGPVKNIGLFRYSKLFGKKVIVHWIGTDVMDVCEYFARYNRLPKHFKYIDKHLAVSKGLQKELREVGIESELVHILTSRINSTVEDFSDNAGILSYWQDERADFYGAEFVFNLARELGDIPFYIAGATGKNLVTIPDNIRFLGKTEQMSEVYSKIFAMVRHTVHDGLSAMVLESLACGKYVFYNHEFPETFKIEDVKKSAKLIRELRSQNEPNYSGADYVKKNYSRNLEMKKLLEIYTLKGSKFPR